MFKKEIVHIAIWTAVLAGGIILIRNMYNRAQKKNAAAQTRVEQDNSKAGMIY